MKFLVAILALFLSASLLAHGGHKVRDRYTDEHGMPYGGGNPPIGAGPASGAHCYYSAYGCSGRGGSTGPRGYRHPASNPYMYKPYGPGYGYGPGWGCGSYQNSGGAVGVRNGHTAGSVYMNQSRGNCGPNGYRSQSRGGRIGVNSHGNVTGSMYWNQTRINP